MKPSTAYAIMAGLAMGVMDLPAIRHLPKPPEQTPEQAAVRISKAEAKRERRRLRNLKNLTTNGKRS